MNIYVLASGSSGNATLIEHKGRFIMVDAGITLKALIAHFAQIGTPEAVFITHSHSKKLEPVEGILQ